MKRIPLGNTVFEGHNNVYLLDGESTVLVDAGVATPATRDELVSGLAAQDVSLADVDEVWLTHWHADHAGLAGEIQDASGATVRVHEADADLVAGDPDAVATERALGRSRFESWGIPEGPRDELVDFLEGHTELRGEPVAVSPLVDGDTLTHDGRTYEVVHLPGHAAGLAAYVSGGEAFVGDAILPKYTPNVGGADLRVDRPLAAYVESLLRLVDLDLDVAYPGHRDPIRAPTDRALTILEHHRERTRRVVSVLERHGPADPWTVSAHLFGDLEEIHILHGPGEAYAHLDHLEHHGVVARDGTEYALAVEDPDVDALFPVVEP